MRTRSLLQMLVPHMVTVPALLVLACSQSEEQKQGVVSEETEATSTTIIWESPNVRIYGDPSLDSSSIDYVERKFEPYVWFKDFPASGKPVKRKAPINFESAPSAKRFKTVITSLYESESPNFANYYVVASWGCGSSCWDCVLIDARDGKIYDGPEAGVGFDYHVNSRLFITSPPDSSGFIQEHWLFETKMWVWNEKEKKFAQLGPVENRETIP